MHSSAWSRPLKRMPPSLSTHRTPLCYRSVALLGPSSAPQCTLSSQSCVWFLYTVLAGCKSHRDSLHSQCHPLHWWNPGALPALCAAGLSSAEQQPGGGHRMVSRRGISMHFYCENFTLCKSWNCWWHRFSLDWWSETDYVIMLWSWTLLDLYIWLWEEKKRQVISQSSNKKKSTWLWLYSIKTV